MHKHKVVCMAICMAVLSFKVSHAGPLHIVKNGKPQATIVIADDASNYQKWAAQWLRDYVKIASGAALPIVVESKSLTGIVVSVGHTKMAKKAGITTDDLKYDGCKLLVKGKVLYLVGRDVAAFAAPAANRAFPHMSGAQGTIRAVTIFLEDIVGVRWLAPGWHGTVVPSTKDISVDDAFSKTFVPAIGYCRGRCSYPIPLPLYANNLRIAVKYQGYGGHSWEVHVDDKEYFDEHPEYFALLPNGKRSRARYSKKTGLLIRNAHLCTSNMEVRQIIVDKMRAIFDEGYDMIQLGQSDAWQPCLCAECMKMDNHRTGRTTEDNPCEKIWLMHNWIMKELYKSHPDKLVNVMVYGPTRWPSKKIDSLPPNAVTEMAPLNAKRIEAWRGKIRKLTTYLYWWENNCQQSSFVPPVSPEWLQKTLRWYRKLGVMGIKGAPRNNWGLGGPSFYAYYKLMGDPDADINKLLHDYCMGIYAESGSAMKRFFRLFHSRSGKTMDLPYFRGSYPAEDAFSTLYPPEIVYELDHLLRTAEAKAKSKQAKGWVKHTRDCFDGLKTVAEMFAAKRVFDLEQSRGSLLRVKARIEAVEAWRERILSYDKAYTDEWFPEYLPMAGYLMTGGNNGIYNEYYYNRPLVRKHQEAFRRGEKKVRGTGMGGNLGHHEISAPITWDFDKVMATLGKPKKEKVIEVVAVRSPMKLDGRIGPEWEGVAAHPFVGYSSAADKITEGATTTVRVTYDAENLYVAYECVEPNVENMKLESVGRDGDVYHHDEVELFLNTDGQSDRKVMQFAASPIENAFYDARKGFITDMLHPDYSQMEVLSWNPKWQYAWHVNRAAKKWTLEMAIPYESIGVRKPEPGTMWTGNFGRCRRVHGEEDVSGWISGTFGSDPSLFGKLVFAGSTAGKKPVKPITEKVPTAISATEKKPARNYIKNGGFEILTQGKPAPWGIQSYRQAKADVILKRCTITTDKAHSGERSLKIDFSDLEPEKLEKAWQMVLSQSLYGNALKGLPGKTVTFSVWVCYENLPVIAGAYLPGPYFDFPTGVGDKKDKKTIVLDRMILTRAYLARLGYVSDTQIINKWIKIEKKLKVPADARSLRIRGQVVGRDRKDKSKINRISVYIDDIRIEVVEE